MLSGVLVLVFVRLRGKWPLWVELHRWLVSLGVPDALRNRDATFLLVGTTLLFALLLGRRAGAGPFEALGLRGAFLRPIAWTFAWTLPMFAAGALMGTPHVHGGLVAMALVAPLVEELFFRGLLVVLPVRYGGLPFWPLAIGSAVLFGLSHISWFDVPSLSGALVVLVTGAGGVFYAWLCRRWGWNLWIPIGLHAFMNLSWGLFSVAENAVGGWEANVARAMTITLAVIHTLRRTPSPK